MVSTWSLALRPSLASTIVMASKGHARGSASGLVEPAMQ